MERDFEWNVRRGAEDAWKMGGSDEDSTFRVENIESRGGWFVRPGHARWM